MGFEFLSRMTAFGTMGGMSLVQEMAQAVYAITEGADPELIGEETLCLVATTTARAIEAGLRESPDLAAAASKAFLDLPFIYRDYLLGNLMVTQDDPSLLERGSAVYERLRKKQAFYTQHFPPNQYPGPRALADKMPLWMGRISPPGMPESPAQRLERLDVTTLLSTHLKLVLAFAKGQKVG